MNLHLGMETNENGNLTISGCDTVALAKQYGTPLYVLDEIYVRNQCKSIKAAMEKCFPSGRVMFASKALNTKAVLRIVASEGLGVDVVSGGELYTALKAEIDPKMIELHGNSKTEDEIRLAVQNQIYCIIADGLDELKLIEKVCREENKCIDVSLRLRPNIDVHAHSAVQTAKMDCKFGFGIIDGQAIEGAEFVLNSKFMHLHGIHCHIGSQIFDEEPFAILCTHFAEFAFDVRQKLGVTFEEFNFGGGFGSKYTDEDEPKSYEFFIKTICDKLSALLKNADYPMPVVSVEPGRSIVSEAGTTLYTVNGVKEIPTVRTYCMCDGGMFENVRTALYGAKYTAVCASKMNESHNKLVSIAGKCCESGDMITWDTPMPETLEAGDILAVLTTGAYNYSMASNYNRNVHPAMVLVNNGTDSLIIKRQTYEEITANDVVPEYLK